MSEPAAPVVPTFPYPRTPDEWYAQAAYVASVMPEWGPADTNNALTLDIIRAKKLRVLPEFGELLVEYATNDFYHMLNDAITRRDLRTWAIFEQIWSDAPDKPYIHEWTGWGRLCDLCSERYVLDEATS